MKRSRLKFSRGSVTVLQIMAEYRKARVKLPNTKLKKKNLQHQIRKTLKMKNCDMNYFKQQDKQLK